MTFGFEAEEEAPAPKESTTDNGNTTTTTTTTLLPEETPLPKSGDLSPTDVGPQPPTPTATDEALPEATGLDTNPQIQDSLDSAAESRHLPSESLTPLPDRQDTTEPEPTETASQEDEDATTTTNAIEREPEPETETPTAKQEEATTADGKQGESQTDDKEKSQEEPKTEEQPATVSPDLASPTSETFTPRLLRRSTAKKEKIKAGKMSNPASPTMGAGWGIASPPALSLDKALEAADPFSTPDLERRMRTVSATTREAERSAKIAEKEKLERALFLQRRSTFDNVANSPTSSTHNSVLGSTSSVAVETGSIGEERPAYALKRASTDRAEKKKKPAAEKKKSRKSDWPDAWPEDFDEEATMPQEPGHPSMWPELHGRASPSPIRGRSGYRTPTPLGQYIEVRECGGMTGDDSADSVGVLQDGGPKDIPPPEPIPEVPSKPIPDVGSDTATPSSVTNKELSGTIKASGKKGRKRRSSSLAVPTDKEEDANIHNSEAEQGDLDTQPSGSAPGTKTKKNKRTRKGKGKATDSSPAANAEDAEGQEASDGDEDPSSGNAQDANAGAAGDALGKKKRKKNKKKGSQTPSGLMSPPLEPNPEVAQLTAQLAQLTDLVQQLVVEKTRSPSVDPDTQSRSRRSSSVTKGNPKIRRTSSGGGGDGETLYDSDGFSIHDEDEELGDDNNETVAADETTKAKRFMGVPYRRGSKSKSDKGGEKGDKAKDKHQQQVGEDPTSELDPHAVHLKTTPREEDEQTGNNHSPQIRDVTAADNERTQLQELFAIDNVNNVIKDESRDSEAGVEFALGRQVVIERPQGNEHADEQPGAQPAEQLQQGRGRGSPGLRGRTAGLEKVSPVGQQAGQEQGAQSDERLVEDQGRAQPGTDPRDGVRGLGAGGRSVVAWTETGDAEPRHDGYESGQAGLQEAEVVVSGRRDGSQACHGHGRGVNQYGDGVNYPAEGVGYDEESIFGHDSYHVEATSEPGSVRDGVDFRSQAKHDEESRVGNDSGSGETTVEHGLDGRTLGRTQDEHGLRVQELQHGRQVLQGSIEDTGADQSGTEHRSGSTGDGQRGDQSAREPSGEGRSVAGSAPTSKAGNDEASVDGHEPSRLTTGDDGSPRIGTGAREGKAQDARPADVRYDVKVSRDTNGRGYADSGFGVQQHARTRPTGAIETGIWVGVWIKLDPSPSTTAAVIGKEQDQQDDEDARVGRLYKEGQEPGVGGDTAGDEQTRFVGVASNHGCQAQQVGSDDLRDESVQAKEEYKPRDFSPGRGLETGNWFVNAAATATAIRGETGSQPGAQVENGQLQQGHDAGVDQGQEREDSDAQSPRAGDSDADAYGILGKRTFERVETDELEQQPVPREPGARGQAEQAADENGKSDVCSEHSDEQEQRLPGTSSVELPGDNDQYQPDGTDGRDGLALASQPSVKSDGHHGDRQQEGKVKDVLQERGHTGNGEQQSIIEQSETERRAWLSDPAAAANGATAARDAEVGTSQLWTGRFPTGIPTGNLIGSFSPANRVDIGTSDVLRVSKHEPRDTVRETEGSGDGINDESTQAGDVVTDQDGHEYWQSQGLERQRGGGRDDDGRREEEGDELQRESELESRVDGDQGDGKDGHGRNVWEEEGEGEGEGQGGLEDPSFLFKTGTRTGTGNGNDRVGGGELEDGVGSFGVKRPLEVEEMKTGVEEVTVSPEEVELQSTSEDIEATPEDSNHEQVELPPSPTVLSDAGGPTEAAMEPTEREFDQQLEKDNELLSSLNPQEIELPPSPSAMSETEKLTEAEIAPIEQILSQQFQNDIELPSSSSYAVNPEAVQLPASPPLSALSDAGELAEDKNETIEQSFNQQSFRDAETLSSFIMNPKDVELPAPPSTLSDAGHLTDTEPVVEQAKQIVEPPSPATADRDLALDKVRNPSPTSFPPFTNRMF